MHKIFETHPLGETAVTSQGTLPTPYHIYAGYGSFIGGVADLDAVQTLIQNEQVTPMQTDDGKAVVGIWVLDFTEASLDPHHELQISIFISRSNVPPISSHPFGLSEAMLTRSDMEMLCYGLWNNTPKVVAYNRELLSLNARLTDSTITKNGAGLNFEINDHETGQLVLKGSFPKFGKTAVRANLEMIKLIGLRKLIQVSRQPWTGLRVVNPTGVLFPHNASTNAMTKNDKDAVNFFDPKQDTLTFGDNQFKQLQFLPLYVQHMEGIKFVYLTPPEAAHESR